MKYNRLGTSGLFVSELGFGAMTFGENEGHPTLGGLGQEEANRLVARAYDAGVNLYDTADLYHRFPAVEGAAYLIGGFTATFMRRGDVAALQADRSVAVAPCHVAAVLVGDQHQAGTRLTRQREDLLVEFRLVKGLRDFEPEGVVPECERGDDLGHVELEEGEAKRGLGHET